MIPIFTKHELANATSRQKLPLKCKQCGKTFLKPKNQICSSISGNKRFTMDYCSNRCQREYEQPTMFANCKKCGSSTKVIPSQIKKSKSGNVFCSKSCAAKWNNAHKTKGTRRSKLEKWLEEQLTKLYPNLEIQFNRKDAIKSELDIYIPSLKLAFEINGIFHYKPIYGQKKLASTQSNDKRKAKSCRKQNIELHVIDVSKMTQFKPQKGQKHLNIIIETIKHQTLSRSLDRF